ncbi:hypothetical protein HKBW3C_02939, partial [Candidatus Hakubella thermalkaliphila]
FQIYFQLFKWNLFHWNTSCTPVFKEDLLALAISISCFAPTTFWCF